MERKAERNYGVDLLRLVSMLFVLILHTLGQGGVLENSRQGTAMFNAAWYLETLAYCAVDVFALISGYVSYTGVRRKTKASSYIRIWLQVVFYGVIATLAVAILKPSIVGVKDIAEMLLPVTRKLYWYFTAYTGLFLIKPLLDEAALALPENTAKKLLAVIFVLFSCYEVFAGGFKTSGGYSFVWIALLYIIGAIIKKFEIGRQLRPIYCVLGIVFLCTVSWAWKVLSGYMHISISPDLLISYVSPTILAAAVLYLILFSKLKLNSPMIKLISFAAPGAFAAYILNNQRYVWSYVVYSRFSFLTQKPVIVMLAASIAFSLLFLACSVIADFVRRKLFKLCRIDKAADAVGRFIDNLLEKLAAKL